MAKKDDFGPFRKTYIRMWSDEKVCRLTRPQPCGLSLWEAMIHGEQTCIVPGLFKIGESAFAEQMGWELEGFRAAFAEISEQGMVKADWNAKLIWVPNALKYNLPTSINCIKSWSVAWERLPDCDLKLEAYHRMRKEIKALSKSFLDTFDVSCRKPFAKAKVMAKVMASGMASGLPSDMDSQNQAVSRKQLAESRKQEAGSSIKNSECAPPPARDSFFSGPEISEKKIPPPVEETFPSPSAQEPDDPDESPIASLQADARECSVAWRKTVLGRKVDAMDSFDVCDPVFLDMRERGIPKSIILEKIGIKQKRRKLMPFCDELESELGMTPQGLYDRPMLAEQTTQKTTEGDEKSEFERGWQIFVRDFKKFVPKCPPNVDFLDRVKALFGPQSPTGAKGIDATPEEMMYALECYLSDPRRDWKQKRWEGVYADQAYRFLPKYITDNREQVEQAARDEEAAKRRASNAATNGPTAELPAPRQPVPIATDAECAKIASALSERIGEARFHLWFVGKTQLARKDEGLVVFVSNLFLHDWMKKTFVADLRAAVKEATGSDAEVKFEIDPEIFGLARAEQTSPTRHPRTNTERKAASA